MAYRELIPVAQVRVGDRIHTERMGKGREVKSVAFYSDRTMGTRGACRPTHVHIDHECYDMQFSQVLVTRK